MTNSIGTRSSLKRILLLSSLILSAALPAAAQVVIQPSRNLISGGTFTGSTFVDPTISVTSGNLNLTLPSQAQGDLLCAASASAFGRLADVATGQVLVSGGIGACPAYSATPSVTEVTVVDAAYGGAWDGSLLVPTRNALYDKIQTLAPLDNPTFTTGVTSPAVTDSGLTSGRIVLASTSGLLADDADFTYDADTFILTNVLGSTAVFIGAKTTSGIRLDLNSGTLEVREGDDSAYAPITALRIDAEGINNTNGDTGNVDVYVAGTIVGNNDDTLLWKWQGSVTPGVGQRGFGIQINNLFTEAASGNHPLLAQLVVNGFTATVGAATVTDAATIYVPNAPSATVSGGLYSIWVDAGNVRLDGELTIGGVSGSGKAVCVKADGDLGVCADAVGAGGTCTCG